MSKRREPRTPLPTAESPRPPGWFKPDKYNPLNPTGRKIAEIAEVWSDALDRRYAFWSSRKQAKEARQGRGFDRGEAHRRTEIPAALVTPWGRLDPLKVDNEMLFQGGRHLSALDHPGFSMWFNLDAPDDVLRQKFELVLGAARQESPFPIKSRGAGARRPRTITIGTIQKWWNSKIIQLCDLEYYLISNDKEFSADILREWLFPDQPVKKVSEARKVLQDVMVRDRIALRHLVGRLARRGSSFLPPIPA